MSHINLKLGSYDCKNNLEVHSYEQRFRCFRYSYLMFPKTVRFEISYTEHHTFFIILSTKHVS